MENKFYIQWILFKSASVKLLANPKMYIFSLPFMSDKPNCRFNRAAFGGLRSSVLRGSTVYEYVWKNKIKQNPSNNEHDH